MIYYIDSMETLIKSSAAVVGSFVPTSQHEKPEIHPVFPGFPCFNSCQNLSPTALVNLTRASLKTPPMGGVFDVKYCHNPEDHTPGSDSNPAECTGRRPGHFYSLLLP